MKRQREGQLLGKPTYHCQANTEQVQFDSWNKLLLSGRLLAYPVSENQQWIVLIQLFSLPRGK